jgi:hypothetical protein
MTGIAAPLDELRIALGEVDVLATLITAAYDSADWSGSDPAIVERIASLLGLIAKSAIAALAAFHHLPWSCRRRAARTCWRAVGWRWRGPGRGSGHVRPGCRDRPALARAVPRQSLRRPLGRRIAPAVQAEPARSWCSRTGTSGAKSSSSCSAVPIMPSTPSRCSKRSLRACESVSAEGTPSGTSGTSAASIRRTRTANRCFVTRAANSARASCRILARSARHRERPNSARAPC